LVPVRLLPVSSLYPFPVTLPVCNALEVCATAMRAARAVMPA
jgi:hypothetical protein